MDKLISAAKDYLDDDKQQPQQQQQHHQPQQQQQNYQQQSSGYGQEQQGSYGQDRYDNQQQQQQQQPGGYGQDRYDQQQSSSGFGQTGGRYEQGASCTVMEAKLIVPCTCPVPARAVFTPPCNDPSNIPMQFTMLPIWVFMMADL